MFEAEGRLLEDRGHSVLRYTVSNDAVGELSLPILAAKTVWNGQASADLARLVEDEKVDVVHFHNTLPLVSPAGYHGARKAGAAVVQTLHNYRLICPGSLLYRDGEVCEKCIGKRFAVAGVRHGCYRGSRAASAAVATMTATHRAKGTWRNTVDRYIAITNFAKEKFVRGGLPEEKISVKPNFLFKDPGEGAGAGGYALFVGRLDKAKGLNTLLEAWSAERASTLPRLIVVGEGALEPDLRAAHDEGRLEWRGWQDREDVLLLMRDAGVLLFPSRVYEGGTPMSIVEAFASGLPVVAANMGTMQSMIEPDATGMLVPPGDASAFADAAVSILSDPNRYAEMRSAVRRCYEDHYAADRNYRLLTQIYEEAIYERHGQGAAA